jgi:hypothetical protein
MLIMTDGGFDFSAADCSNWMLETGMRDPCPDGRVHSMSLE